ncbi:MULTISPECIES: hypothetical protein [Clostridia]|uniref:hypothetical protein n=1 Tax=Clostridia TaxID=186801 RepID=UPI000EB2A09D|nr:MULTISPECIES: hypothetical protein [Clostridia]RKQ22479.1 hypothetical protein D8Q48_16760 [Ruminococcus sp. B05]TAP31982.1 hypothetical protein EYA86_11305 [Mediterraneibacter sp. gm002]
MNQKRKYIIDNLFVDNFIEFESRIIYLEEKEDSGKSLLEIQLNKDGNLSIKNVDMKNTRMYYFKSDKVFSMNKRVDHIIFEYVSENDWKLHLIEMKSSVGRKKWNEIKGKFRASYLLAQGIAAMLELNIVSTHMYTSYEKVQLEVSDTLPSERRMRIGEHYVKPEEEWEGDKFALNFGERLTFEHIPIQMTRNEEDILIGNYMLG